MARDKIIIYTDGGCSDNQRKQNRGGWGAVIILPDQELEIFGGEANTTNNRMELTACIKALETVEQVDMPAVIYSDSAYLVNCINQKWYVKWRSNGWQNSKKQPVENRDLWERILELVEGMEVSFKKVAGHSGVELNERADRLANKGIENPGNENPAALAAVEPEDDPRYTYRRVEGGFLIRLRRDAIVMETLLDFLTRHRIVGGSLSGIGALKDAALGFYRLTEQVYERTTLNGIYELVSFEGNISMVDEKPFIHAHAAFSDDQFRMFGGHFFDAVVAITMEVYITPFKDEVVRSRDKFSGLNLLDF